MTVCKIQSIQNGLDWIESTGLVRSLELPVHLCRMQGRTNYKYHFSVRPTTVVDWPIRQLHQAKVSCSALMPVLRATLFSHLANSVPDTSASVHRRF